MHVKNCMTKLILPYIFHKITHRLRTIDTHSNVIGLINININVYIHTQL